MPLLMNTSSFACCRRAGSGVAVGSLLLVFAMFVASGCREGASDRGVGKSADQPVEAAAKESADGKVGGEGRSGSTKVSVDFPGGTLGELRNHLPKAPNPPFNLIVGVDAASTPLPAFSVRDADSTQLARALTHQLHPYGISIVACDFVFHGAGSGGPVYVTYRDPSNQPYDLANLKFWSLRVEPEDASRFVAAVQSAWEIRYRQEKIPATLRYHEETRQLFMSGPETAFDIGEKVAETFPWKSDPAGQP